MTITTYLAAMSLGAVAVSLTAICGAATTVIVFYSYKWASGMIKNRSRNIAKLKKHKMFKEVNPAISILKQRRANGKA